MHRETQGRPRWAVATVIRSVALLVGLGTLTGEAVTLSLGRNTDYHVGPMLATWSTANDVFRGLSVNGWTDNSTAFKSATVTYPTGIGQRDAGSSGLAYTDWWLDGNYTTFSGLVRLDDRTAANPNAIVKVIADGVTLATSPGIVANGSYTFTGLNVTGAKTLRLQVSGEGWGGRPVHYVFWTQADATGTPGLYYNDTLNATVSSSARSYNAATFTSAANQAGGTGTTPSVNTWFDTGNPLKVGGQVVPGVGVTGPTYSAGGSVKWTLSPSNDYRLLTFDVARDDRWTSGISDGALKLLINGVQVDSYGILDVANGGPAPGFRKTYSYLLSGASTIEFTMGGAGWGGASKAYYDIIDPRLIAVPEPATGFALLLAGGALVAARRRRG